MSKEQLASLTQAQRDRLAFIELRLWFVGEFRRHDLVNRYGIQAAAATRDIGQYRELAPHNVEYDTRGKVYIPAEPFHPIFSFPPERVFNWLAKGYGDSEPLRSRSIVVQDGSSIPTKVDLQRLSVLTRAIYSESSVGIAYRSLSSGLTKREIVPFALADNGLRWHVRAYDRRSNEFRDFVLGRLEDARIIPGAIQDHERQDQDIQWNRVTELDLVPHPGNIHHPDTIEAEYGMRNGVLHVRTRAAMAGYLLRRWNVDCTKDHRLRGAEYHLWLRNRQALYGINNLMLAPGYSEADTDV